MKYGQQTFTKEPIGNFQGNFNDATVQESAPHFFERLLKKAKREVSDALVVETDPKKHLSAVHSRDAKLHHLYSTLQTKPGHKITIDLSSELNARMRTDHVFEDLLPHYLRASASEPLRPRNFECLKNAVNTFEKFCGKMSDYDLKYVRHLVVLCESVNNSENQSVYDRIEEACSH